MGEEGSNWVRAASAGEVAAGEMKQVSVQGRALALYHLDDGSWRASDNLCTHAFALLTEGWLDGAVVECPLHGGRFDLDTGAGLGAPIEADLAVYKVRVEGADVLVLLPSAPAGGG